MTLPVKQFKFGDDARATLLAGMKVVKDVVSSTMGAQGRYTLFRYGPRASVSTKDGYMSARQIYLENPFEDMGAYHLLEAMFKTTRTSGDGTTLTCLLTYEIFKGALKYIVAGANPVFVKKGIELAIKDIIEQIKLMARPIESSKDLRNIARVSLNGDDEIAGLIQEAIDTVGENGAVTCRESKDKDNRLELISGMTYKEGYEAPDFINNVGNRSWTADNPYIFCYKGEIHTGEDITGIISQVLQENRPLLMVCHEVETEIVRNIISTKFKYGLNACLITTPGQAIGHNRDDILEDIAIYTSSDVFSEFGASAKKAIIPNLGSARRIIVKEMETTIIDGAGTKEAVEARIQAIETDLAETDEESEKERLTVRKARLSSGVAIIHIGAVTTTELSEKKDRVEDALQAVHAAKAEGTVPGGGIALLNCRSESVFANEDVKYGYDLVFNIKKSAIFTILENAGIEDPQTIITKCLNNHGSGYDVSEMKEVEDMEASGIIDPAKVVRVALENAASEAGILLLTESIICNKEKTD